MSTEEQPYVFHTTENCTYQAIIDSTDRVFVRAMRGVIMCEILCTDMDQTSVAILLADLMDARERSEIEAIPRTDVVV